MTQQNQPRVLIEPSDERVDVARRIVLSGFGTGDVQVSGELRHPDGSLWRSKAVFRADAQGQVDLSAQAPVSGDWQEPDAMALVWSMRRIEAPADPAASDGVAPLTIAIRAQGAGGEQAQAAFVQRYLAPGVQRQEIREGGLVGTLFAPAGAGPHPAVVVFNGSGGGIPEQRAALWAAHGYAAFALGYFKAPGRPDHISGMPLEYFEQGLRWVHDTVQPHRGFVAVTGQSRGGELSLLLGARFAPLVSAVVAYVPSSMVHGSLRAGAPGEPRDTPVWTWRGQPLPNAWQGNPQADWTAFDAPAEPGQPIRQAAAFHSVLRNAEAVAAARIPIEQIAGPVMLISGTDDGFWPSTLYSETMARDLARAGHAWPVEHVRCESAGHAIGLPYVPTTLIAKPHPVAGVVLSGGGTPQANARANEQSWQAALRFVGQAVRAREDQQ